MRIILLFIVVFCFVSCQDKFLGKDPDNTPRSNFESLWKTLDEKYSFFSYKGIDWNDVYNRYSAQIKDTMTDVHLFNVFFEMLSELRDSHVNLSSPFNVSRYEKEFTSSPLNFDERVVNSYYLKSNYYITGPFKHQIIASGAIGYVRYASFEDEVLPGNIDFVISRFKDLKGLSLMFAAMAVEVSRMYLRYAVVLQIKTRLVYTSYPKNGPGHEDFAGPNQVFVSPSDNAFTKKICVLTNRGSYSATSFFVLAMRNFPNVTVVGDTTGGGLGAPTGAELPNGWAYRFSCSKTLSPEGENLEDGIPPDVPLNLSSSDLHRNIDSIIEKAKSIILSSQ